MTKGCRCSECVAACHFMPGVFHPVEALKAIRAGFASDMMSVTIGGKKRDGRAREDDFDVLMPRSIPPVPVPAGSRYRHHRNSTWDANGRCIFLNIDDGCEIHDSGFKPHECRNSYLCRKIDAGLNIRDTWKTPVGMIVLSIWRVNILEKSND